MPCTAPLIDANLSSITAVLATPSWPEPITALVFGASLAA